MTNGLLKESSKRMIFHFIKVQNVAIYSTEELYFTAIPLKNWQPNY
jgi:hypothetical protein